MISPGPLKSVLDDGQPKRSAESFLRVHRHLEGYFKRVLLIGLRLHGAQYKPAVQVVDAAHLTAMVQIEKAIVLLDASGNTHKFVIDAARRDFPDLFALVGLFQRFTAPFRNRLAHGVIDEIRDDATVEALLRVDIGLYRAFEEMLSEKHGRSAFEQPRAWGAVPGGDEGAEALVARLRLGRLSPEPIKTETVEAELLGIRHAAL